MQSAGIEVWTARPDGLGCETCAELAALLDQEELQRAAQLRFEADRRAFIVAHAVRRLALSLALATDPKDLRFGTGPQGEPVLLHAAAEALSFSLTRSRGLVACAISSMGPVGVDAEPIRDAADPELLETFMDPVQAGEGALAFYQQWTALEAFWKARGLGLSTSHPRIRLRPLPDADDCFEVVYGDSGLASGTVVLHLPAPEGYVLSLACREVASVRLVSFDRLAAAPRAIAGAEGPSDPAAAGFASACAERRCARGAMAQFPT